MILYNCATYFVSRMVTWLFMIIINHSILLAAFLPSRFFSIRWPLHMDDQRQDDQLELTYRSSELIRDVALKTCRKQWTIKKGGEKGSGISVLMERHDDDNDESLSRLFSQSPGYPGSIPGWVIPKTQKMILATSLLNT